MNSRRSMGATATLWTWSCTVRLVVEDATTLRAARADLTELLDRVDRAASRFRPDSALSVANARAGRPAPVPRLLVDLVGAALDGAARTDGLVVPTAGAAVVALGYDRDIADVTDAVEPVDPRPAGNWRAVGLDRETGLLTVPFGCTLDLGATAKAYTADLAAHTLSRRYGTAVLVELGGDLAVAGVRPDGWCIKVAEAESADDGQLVLVRAGGLATSTTTVRTWRRGGRKVHHVVDPRTGLPTEGPWRTATVAAPSAFEANLASTAALVLGADAEAWLDQRHLAARLVGQDGSVRTTAGWPTARQLTSAR